MYGISVRVMNYEEHRREGSISTDSLDIELLTLEGKRDERTGEQKVEVKTNVFIDGDEMVVAHGRIVSGITKVPYIQYRLYVTFRVIGARNPAYTSETPHGRRSRKAITAR